MPADTDRHLIAGRMSGASGIATFCMCGLVFFAPYGGVETNESRMAASNVADARWSRHRRAAEQPAVTE